MIIREGYHERHKTRSINYSVWRKCFGLSVTYRRILIPIPGAQAPGAVIRYRRAAPKASSKLLTRTELIDSSAPVATSLLTKAVHLIDVF